MKCEIISIFPLKVVTKKYIRSDFFTRKTAQKSRITPWALGWIPRQFCKIVDNIRVCFLRWLAVVIVIHTELHHTNTCCPRSAARTNLPLELLLPRNLRLEARWKRKRVRPRVIGELRRILRPVDHLRMRRVVLEPASVGAVGEVDVRVNVLLAVVLLDACLAVDARIELRVELRRVATDLATVRLDAAGYRFRRVNAWLLGGIGQEDRSDYACKGSVYWGLGYVDVLLNGLRVWNSIMIIGYR